MDQLKSIICYLTFTLCAIVPSIPTFAQHTDANTGKPDPLIVSGVLHGKQRQLLIDTAHNFYMFWNTGDPNLLSRVLSPTFTDQDLPPGRPQGPGGPLFAFRQCGNVS